MLVFSELADCQWGAVGKDHRSRTSCYDVYTLLILLYLLPHVNI